MKSKKSKKKTKKRLPRKKSGHSLKIKKRRGKNIYDIDFPKINKTEEKIDSLIDSLDYSKLKSDNEFIKITFVEKKGKEIQSFTDLAEYSYESRKDLREQIKDRMKDLNYTFHRIPAQKSKAYWKTMYKLRNYLTKIVIDFDTAD